jgi:hypothetical protein
MPSAEGYIFDSQGAIFYTDDNGAYFVLSAGSSPGSAFASLGNFPTTAIPFGAGLWTQAAEGKPAEYFTTAGTPDHTVPIRGTLVGGNATDVFAQAQSPTAGGGTQPALLRFPVDGSPSGRLALPPKVGQAPLLYDGKFTPTVTADGFVTIWESRADGQPSVLLQWVALP